MKEAYRCVYLEDAVVVKSLLDSAGIKARVLNGDMMDVNPFFSASVEGVRILVSDEDYEDARAVVDDFEARRGEEREAGSSQPRVAEAYFGDS